MAKNEIFAEVNQFSEDAIISAAGLQTARDGKSCVCPQCGTGSNGGKGDGIRQKEYPQGSGKFSWYCYGGLHTGKRSMSNCDVIAAAYGISDNAELARKLEELFPDLKEPKDFSSSKENSSGTEERKNYSKMYTNCRNALPSFLATQPDWKWRELTNETLHEAGVGYNCNYRGKRVMIIPYDDESFFWREVDGNGRGMNKGGKRRLLETLPLKTGAGKVNFLTEGEIDALSIKQALVPYKENFGVASIGSVSFDRLLVKELDKTYGDLEEKPRIIWLADNDAKDKEGKSASKIVDALNAAGYPAIKIYFAPIGEVKVDANEYLQRNGTYALGEFLLGVADDNESELDAVEEKIKAAIREQEIAEAEAHGITRCTVADYLSSGRFDSELATLSKFSGRKTGFANLDEKQIFLPALYVLGGAPGTGKTTFAWQLLNQLAAGDVDRGREKEYCVYCSYEMTLAEMISKSIAREMRRKHLAKGTGLCLSSADIRRGFGHDSEEFKAARTKLEKQKNSLTVLELRNTTVEELLAELKREAKAAGDMPLNITIDYLQLVPITNQKATARERVDEVMLRLKTFQKEVGATVLLLSSLSRDANKYGGNQLFSFKESGSIEYSSDVTWSLTRENPEVKTLPRKIKLSCTKNRNGDIFDVWFDYYAQSDYFVGSESASDEDEEKAKPKRKYTK